MNPKSLITLALVGGAGYLIAVRMGWLDGFNFLPAATTDDAAADTKAAADKAAADAAAKAAAAAAAAASGDAAAAAAAKLAADAAAKVAADARIAADKAAADQVAAVAARVAAEKVAADSAAAKLAAEKASKGAGTFEAYIDGLNLFAADPQRRLLTADQWNYYYTKWSGIEQTADVFPEGDRNAPLTVGVYLQRRKQVLGLSGFRGLAAWAPTSPRLARGVPRGSINYRRAAQGRRFVA